MKLTGAQALIKSLEMEGVEVMFGLPGGCILPAYDPLLDSSIRHILVRHEQGAGHMAEGFARASGKVGVAMATSGPGATNLVTPIADAWSTSLGTSTSTGPGRPVVAMWNASRMMRGRSSGVMTSSLCFVTERVMPTVSHS